MATRLLLPPQVMGADGRPVSGAKLNTYTTGTSTAKAVYSDAALTIAHANPVVADANGRFPAMFMAGGDYRVVLADADDAVIATYDPVEGAATSAAGTTSSPLRNRLLNPGMQISQEAGTANVDITTGADYVLDVWRGSLSSTPGGTLRIAQTASVTPGGSPYRLRCTVQATDSSIAAGDFYYVDQIVEAPGFADARFGSASARQIIVRFGIRSSVAGTFGVSLTNSAGNRSYVGTITVAAGEINTDLERSLTIPGDTSGTWLTAVNTIGVYLRICLAAGSTFQGAAGWQAGNFLTTSSQTNLMATSSATFDVFDAGLYVDPEAVGTVPEWELPDYATDLRRVQRYFQTANLGIMGTTTSSTVASMSYIFPVEMCDTPAFAELQSAIDIRIGGASSSIAGEMTLATATTKGAALVFTRDSGTWTANIGADVVDAGDVCTFDARL